MILLPSLHLGSLLHVLCKRAGLLNRTASALGRLHYTHTPITSRGASRAGDLYRDGFLKGFDLRWPLLAT